MSAIVKRFGIGHLDPYLTTPPRDLCLSLQFIIVGTQAICGEGHLHETTQLPKPSSREQCKHETEQG